MSSSADPRAGSVDEPRLAPVPDLRLMRLPEPRDRADGVPLHAADERARTRAEADGYASGWFRGVADGRRRAESDLARTRTDLADAAAAAEAHRTAAHEAAVRALHEAARSLADQLAVIREEVTADAADLAAVLVEAILGRELGRLDLETAAHDVVRRVVGALGDLAAESPGHGDQVQATVRLAPAVLEAVDEESRDALARLGARLVADPAIARDDAVVDAASTRVDLRLHSTLQRVRAALIGDPS